MQYGIIDIGSNTIRGVAYKVLGSKTVKIEDKLVRSHLLDETVNGVLSESGINRLIVVLNKLQYLLKNDGCKMIRCFATSSLRNVVNAENIKKTVKETTGIRIDILSGTQEAECDFIALRQNVPEHSAIGLDLGGGSCQIMQFQHNSLVFSESYDIGSNRMKLAFVKGALPTTEERRKIEFFVKNELLGLTNQFGSRYFYAMGGTAKTALRLYNRLSNTVQRDGFLSKDKIDLMCRMAENEPEKMYNIFQQTVKARSDTIIPGLIVLHAICDILEVDGAYVLSCGVREGYFAKLLSRD